MSHGQLNCEMDGENAKCCGFSGEIGPLDFEEVGGGCRDLSPFGSLRSPPRTLPIETKVESEKSQEKMEPLLKSGTSVNEKVEPLVTMDIGPLDFEEVGGGCRDQAPVEAGGHRGRVVDEDHIDLE